MSNIDWSKAPSWADRVLAMGMAGAWAWANEHQYQYIGNINKEIFLYEEENTWKLADGELVEMRNNVEVWQGTGLPPVGTVCEFYDESSSVVWREGLENGSIVEILAHYSPCGDDDLVAVFCYEIEGGKLTDQAVADCFRPVRTQEQIEADALREIVRATHVPNGYVEEVIQAVLNAGYRLQPKEDA